MCRLRVRGPFPLGAQHIIHAAREVGGEHFDEVAGVAAETGVLADGDPAPVRSGWIPQGKWPDAGKCGAPGQVFKRF